MANPALTEKFDVVVIGGGIQGAGCAQALAARQHRVLLLEKSTFGSETSSKSSKLIHGGLRYLETGQLRLVRKSLRERATLLELAPELVKAKPFLIPVYKNQRLGSLMLTAGLSLYSLLGGLDKYARFHRIPAAHWNELDGLETHNLRAVFQYWDAQTDDRLLTNAVVQSAVDHQCLALEKAEFVAANRLPDGGFDIEFRHEGETLRINSTAIVNAAGPWASQVQAGIEAAPAAPQTDLVKGSHIELDQSISDRIFYVEAPSDQRPVFIMPRHGATLVGTTEEFHEDYRVAPEASNAEQQYLLETLLHYFPGYHGKITASWAGLRVLPHTNAAPGLKRRFSKRQRDTMVVRDSKTNPRIISLFGGKLTAYRVTAEKVAQELEQTLGTKPGATTTETLTLQTPGSQ